MFFQNRLQGSCLSWLLLCQLTAQSLPASSQTIRPTEIAASQELSPAPEHAAIPEGRVLPQGVGRSWMLHRQYAADSGFDEQGNKIRYGLERNTEVSAFVAEYGLTPRLSIRMMFPWVDRNELRIDQQQFMQSAAYQRTYHSRAEQVVQGLMKAGLCTDPTECRQSIDNGLITVPVDQVITLNTGESVTLLQGKSYRQQLETLILKTATPPLHGALGPGDMETGLLFNAFRSETLFLSTGLGLRIPTGIHDVPEMRRPVSSGIYELGLRLNADFSPVSGLWLSFQEQLEHALSRKKWNRPSLIDNTQFNKAEPQDGLGNELTYEKKGIQHATMLKASYGFGALSNELKFLAAHVRYLYQHDRAIRLNGEEKIDGIITAQTASESQSAGAGITFSGLPYRIPAEFDVSYLTPVAGKDSKLSAGILESWVRVYARF